MYAEHPYLGYPSISQKNCAMKLMLFSISMRKTDSTHEIKNFCNLWDQRVNRGQKRPLCQKVRIWSKEKKIIYQFFNTRICAFMTYGQFPPRSSSNSRFVTQDSKVRGPHGGEALFRINADSTLTCYFKYLITVLHIQKPP